MNRPDECRQEQADYKVRWLEDDRARAENLEKWLARSCERKELLHTRPEVGRRGRFSSISWLFRSELNPKGRLGGFARIDDQRRGGQRGLAHAEQELSRNRPRWRRRFSQPRRFFRGGELAPTHVGRRRLSHEFAAGFGRDFLDICHGGKGPRCRRKAELGAGRTREAPSGDRESDGVFGDFPSYGMHDDLLLTRSWYAESVPPAGGGASSCASSSERTASDRRCA